MKRAFTFSALSLALALTGTSAFADGHIDAAIKARQSQMQLYAFNIGALGAMAKGTRDYDAAAATAAANNLAALTVMDQSAMWPQGSDSGAAKTRAKAKMWSNFPEVMTKGQALAAAAAAMQTAAGTDLASLRGAMGDLGGACGACHKAFREPEPET